MQLYGKLKTTCSAAIFAAALLISWREAAAQRGGAAAGSTTVAASSLPSQLTSAQFWKLVTDISEPGGYFHITDNYTSNEGDVSQLFTYLKSRGQPASVYMGVGPEQNLTYIAATRPRMAFIVDIRRQAVMQHLMFKAMFELSNNRADFLSLLFSKPRPAGVDSIVDIQKLWDAYWYLPVDASLRMRNRTSVVDKLTKTHGFVFTADEMSQLQNVINAFVDFGPEISTRSTSQGGRAGGTGVTFADLTGYRYDDAGLVQSFMSTEDNFRFVKSLHDKNLIIPVSGDFGGPKAIRAIGAYLKEVGGTVSVYYVSNVEQYLFQDFKNAQFYANVATLPLDSTSIFLRPTSIGGRGRGGSGATPVAICPILPFLAAVNAGRVPTYNNATACSR
jgi:hypothetical protein